MVVKNFKKTTFKVYLISKAIKRDQLQNHMVPIICGHLQCDTKYACELFLKAALYAPAQGGPNSCDPAKRMLFKTQLFPCTHRKYII